MKYVAEILFSMLLKHRNNSET